MMERCHIRAAELRDVAAIEALIDCSARALSHGYYSRSQTEAAIEHVFGVDTTLISDGTYFLALSSDGLLRGCGGWSKRRKLFGGDQFAARDASFSDPALVPAKIRAFFVHPASARTGIGRALLARCEAEAKTCGYKAAELMSTLPGVKFYESCGYLAAEPVSCTVADVQLEFVPMRKSLVEASEESAGALHCH